MRNFSLLIFTVFGISAHAKSTSVVHGRLINYGNLPTKALSLEVVYFSDNHTDGSCGNCIERTFSIPIKADGTYMIPRIRLDSNINHSHNFKVSYVVPGLEYEQGRFYACSGIVDIETETPCEEVFARDLSILSAYTFQDQPFAVTLPNGLDFATWLLQVHGFRVQFHVRSVEPSNLKPYSGLGLWAILGNCNEPSQCFINQGAVMLVGKDYGPHAELWFKFDAAGANGDGSYGSWMPFEGIEGQTLTVPWNGGLPEPMWKFLIKNAK